jgi:hypothetical protein
MKKVKGVNVFDVLSIHVWIWNIETCWSHHKKGNEVHKRIMEGMGSTNIYGNVTGKSPGLLW